MQNQPNKTEPVGLEYLEQTLRELGEFYYWPNHGNIGDLLIAEATRQYFSRLGLKWRSFDPTAPPSGNINLVYGGGGRFSSHWRGPVGGIAPLVSESICTCVILPHSFNGVAEELSKFDERHILFCRERRSYEYVRRVSVRSQVYMANDMALLYKPWSQVYPELEVCNTPASEDSRTQQEWLNGMGSARMSLMVQRAAVSVPGTKRRIAFLLRTDAEKSSSYDTKAAYDISAEWNGNCVATKFSGDMINAFAGALNQVDVVVTDRLHVSIMSMLLGKEVFMLDNDYGKLSAVYDYSLAQVSSVKLLPANQPWPDEIQQAWRKLNAPWRMIYYRARRQARRKIGALKSLLRKYGQS